MSSDPFYTFLAFVTQDAKILALSKKIAELTAKKEQFLKILNERQAVLTQAQQVAHQARKAQDAQELEVKSLQGRQRLLKEKLESSSSPKEYFSLETELKNLVAEMDRQETILYGLFEQFESAEKKMGEIDFEVVALKADTDTQVAQLDQQIDDLKREMQQESDVLNRLETQVNPEMREKFIAMKASLANPVVPVKQNVCSACYNMVGAQDLVGLRRHQLVTCQNCYRLLYSDV